MLTFKLAWRNLLRNVRRTLLAGLLISSALIVLILVDGLVIGMVDALVGGLTRTLEGEAQVNRKGFREHYDADLYLPAPGAILETLEKAPEVAGLAPRVIASGMIASSYNTAGGLVYGVDAQAELGVSRIREAVYEGRYLTGARREILLGKLLAELLEVRLGERIVITTAKVGSSEIAQELFRVAGFLEFGPEAMDESLAFVNLADAQALLGLGDGLHQVAIRLQRAEDGKDPQLPALAPLNQGETEALGWLALQPALGGMIEMSRFSTALVAAILFVLTSLGVVNAMFMSIYERIHEFGVAKALGARPSQVALLVLCEALLLALLACAAGACLGYLASAWFAEHGVPFGRMEVAGVVLDGNLKTAPRLYQFIAFPLYVTLLTLAAALYPALFAARIVPTRALQRSL